MQSSSRIKSRHKHPGRQPVDCKGALEVHISQKKVKIYTRNDNEKPRVKSCLNNRHRKQNQKNEHQRSESARLTRHVKGPSRSRAQKLKYKGEKRVERYMAKNTIFHCCARQESLGIKMFHTTRWNTEKTPLFVLDTQSIDNNETINFNENSWRDVIGLDIVPTD